MSASTASRKTTQTILQSIYCIRRRRTALPLSEVTNSLRLNNNSHPDTNTSNSISNNNSISNSAPKSLIQGQKVTRPSCVTTAGAPSSSSPAISLGNRTTPQLSQLQTRRQTHRNWNLKNNNVDRNGALLRGIGIREHYAATAPTHSSPNLLHLGEQDDYSLSSSSSSPSVSSASLPSSPSSLGSEEEATHEKSDLVVVLDLDECLIHSQFNVENQYRQYEERPQSQAFTNDTYEPSSLFASACDSFRFALPDGDLVHVNKRPNLDTFLQEVTSRYETHIFTAAMEVYASPLLDILDPSGTMFAKRYYRESCLYLSSHGVYVKDLSRVLQEEYNSKRIVLVDNNPMSFISNPKNGILVSNFYDDPKDDTLQAVLELLDELDGEEDVRPLLNDKFALKASLKEVMDVHQGKW